MYINIHRIRKSVYSPNPTLELDIRLSLNFCVIFLHFFLGKLKEGKKIRRFGRFVHSYCFILNGIPDIYINSVDTVNKQ